jgi:hypothetical protein
MDKVKLHAQERLDLDDTRALQSLVYDYVSEALGGLMGNAKGVLSIPEVNFFENNGAPYIELRPFAFMASTQMRTGDTGSALSDPVTGGTAYKQFHSIVVNYDPEEEADPHIDLDALRSSFTVYVDQFGPQYIWARPTSVDTNTATRRRWDVSSGAEVTFSESTRESQRVAFVVQSTEPASVAGESRWAKIAQIESFTDGDNTNSQPVLKWLSVFDDPLNNEYIGATDASVSMDGLLAFDNGIPFDSSSLSYRSFGLPMLLSAIRSRLQGITGRSTWYYKPTESESLLGLSDRITNLEAVEVGSSFCIASCTVGVEVVNDTTQRFTAELYGNSVGIDRSFTALIRGAGFQQNNVRLKIKDAVLDQGWAITHVSVQQIKNAGLVDAVGHLDFNRVTFLVPAHITNTADTSDPNSLALEGTNRGISVDFIPHVIRDDGQAHAHSEDSFHEPLGSVAEPDISKVLDDLTAQTVTPYDLMFSVAVFAVPADQVDR